MGLSVRSAFEIQGNETLVDIYKDKESGKYGYIITHSEEKYCRPIVSCNPFYDSQKKALIGGKELMNTVKEMDLSPKRRELVNRIGGQETAKTIDRIVKSSKD